MKIFIYDGNIYNFDNVRSIYIHDSRKRLVVELDTWEILIDNTKHLQELKENILRFCVNDDKIFDVDFFIDNFAKKKGKKNDRN
jgi:hypothetical protein